MSSKVKTALALVVVVVAVWWLWPAESDDSGAAPTAGAEASRTGDQSGSSETRSVGTSRAGEASVAELQEELQRAQMFQGGPVTVSGRVLDAASGEPVPYVDVVFRAKNVAVSANTGASGRYSTELVPDAYGVRAIGDGLLGAGEKPLVVTGGEDISFDVTVQKLAILRGQVVDERGRPAGGARVEYGPVTRAQKDHKKFGDWPAIVNADASGRFEISVIPGGDVHLDAYADGRRGHAYLKGIVPGSQREGIVIVLDGGVLIDGIVVDASGSPVPGATVQAYMRERHQHMTERHETTTDDSGRFAFERMISGVLTLEAIAPGHAPSAPKPSKLEPGSSTSFELRLQPPQTISGKVLGPDGTPQAGVTVTAKRKHTRLPPVETTTARDGSFTLEGLGGGPHTVAARTDDATKASVEVRPPGRGVVLRLSGDVPKRSLTR